MYETDAGNRAHEPEERTPKSPFALFMEHFYDIVKLNLLVLLFSLPVVTAPAACTASSYLYHRMVTGQNYAFWDDFWRRFRREFRASLICGLFFGVLFALVLLVLVPMLRALFAAFTPTAAAGCALLVLAAAFVLSAAMHAFSMIALVELPLPVILANAWKLVIVRPMQSLAGVLFAALLTVAMILTFPFTLPFLFFLYFGPIGFVFACTMKDGLALCMTKPQDKTA